MRVAERLRSAFGADSLAPPRSVDGDRSSHGVGPRAPVPVPSARRLRWLTQEPASVLAPLVVVQWIVVVLFALVAVEHNGWLFYQGGDQTWFYTSAWMLGGGEIPESLVGYAWPFVLTPIAIAAGPSILAGLPAIVLLQVAVLVPVALLAIYGLASRIGGRLLGYWAAGLWIVLPYLAIPLFVDRYHATYVEQTLPQVLGLTALGDFPSMVAVLVAAYFCFRSLDTGDAADAVATGLASGFAIGIKPANGLFVLAPVLAFALTRRRREFGLFALALLPALLTLTIWKARGSGIAFLNADAVHLAAAGPPDYSPMTRWERLREYVPLDVHQLNQQFLGFREYFWSARLLEYVPIAGAIAVARRSGPKAAFLAVWLAGFFVVKGSHPAVNVETGSIWRLLMPAFPAIFLLMASIPLLAPVWGNRLAPSPPRQTLRIGRAASPYVAAVVALFAVPLALVVVLPPSDGDRAAKLPHQSLFVPHSAELRLAVEPAGDVLRLSWTPARGAADAFYVVLRSPRKYWFPQVTGYVTRGIYCGGAGRGSPQCSIEMVEVGRTRDAAFVVDAERGRWTYRIGVAANWRNDLDAGDILVVSKPLDVNVT